MMRFQRSLLCAVLLMVCVTSHAQLDILESDDFVEPSELRDRKWIFVSRIAAGAARGYRVQNRSVGQDIGFVHFANSLYWESLQFDYKHSQVRGENPPPMDDPPCHETLSAQASLCTQARADDREPPAPGAKNVLQVAWYQTVGQRATIRYRLTQARQYARPETAAHVPGLKSHDDTRGAQIDAGVRVRGRTLSGYASYSELTPNSTLDKTKQKTLTLGAFLPLMSVGPAILTPRLQIAGIAGAGPAIDVINPTLDLSWTIPHADTNVHVIYSPAFDLGGGTKVKHQVVFFADYGLAFPRGRRRS